MIDFSQIQKILITSEDMFFEWVKPYIDNNFELIGFDIETNGEDFPRTQLAGFSLYSWVNSRACYVPINHVYGTPLVSLDKIRDKLQCLFTTKILITHGGAYDFLNMNKLGFKFYNVIDSLLIAIAMQFKNLGLKELSLEYGLARYQEIITFEKLMNKLGFPDGTVDFTLVNVAESKEAFEYAVKDSIFTYHLAKLLYTQYENHVGTDVAGSILKAQTDTMLLLCESSSKGILMDKVFLEFFIKQYGGELRDLEIDLMDRVRKAMGWDQKSEKKVADVSGLLQVLS